MCDAKVIRHSTLMILSSWIPLTRFSCCTPPGHAVPLPAAAGERERLCSFIATVPWCTGVCRVWEKLAWTWSRVTTAFMWFWKGSKSCRKIRREEKGCVCVTQCSRFSMEVKSHKSSSGSRAVRSHSKKGVSKR